jgi:hypothetical protein
MLPPNFDYNYRTLRSFTSYACDLGDGRIERDISFHVDLGPSTERRGDVFPVWETPTGRMSLLSDWSFNGGHVLTRQVVIGGSLGRITAAGQYIYVLNCAVFSGEMQPWSVARPVRYLPGQWIAVCFHHTGLLVDTQVRATFRLVEVPAPEAAGETSVWDWASRDGQFPGPG